MWVPSSILDWFRISKESFDDLRTQLASVRTERDLLTAHLASSKANFEWLRVRVNSLELERATLLEKVYGVKVATPEIARTPSLSPLDFTTALFEDMGDDEAKKRGLPSYSN